MKIKDLILESFESTTTKLGMVNKNVTMASKIDTMNTIKNDGLEDAKQFILKFNKDVVTITKKMTWKSDTLLLKAIDLQYDRMQKSYSLKNPGKFLPEEIKKAAFEMMLSTLQQTHIDDMKRHMS